LLSPPRLGGMDNDARIHHIAARLNTEKYDVVTLNEVWLNIQDPVVTDPTTMDASLIYLLTKQSANATVDPAALEKRYSALSSLPGEAAKAPTGQYPYFVWAPGFQHAFMKSRGDAALMLATQFAPLPRKVNQIANVEDIKADGLNFYCFGRGQIEFEKQASQKFGADVLVMN